MTSRNRQFHNIERDWRVRVLWIGMKVTFALFVSGASALAAWSVNEISGWARGFYVQSEQDHVLLGSIAISQSQMKMQQTEMQKSIKKLDTEYHEINVRNRE